MELTQEKSQEQADIILSISMQVMLLDVDYCKELVTAMCKQSNLQDSMAVLNSSYSPIKSDILRVQAEALSSLCDYVDALKQVDDLKNSLQREQKGRDLISRLFI